jgi:CRISPR-associated protein Cmr3
MTAAPCSALEPSSKRNPCPICSRTKDGDCRTGDGLAICHHGSTHHPPEGLRPGDVIEGRDGQWWAFTSETTDGRGSTFTLDKPRHQPNRVGQLRPPANSHKPALSPISGQIELARLQSPANEPPAHLPDGMRLSYSSRQWVRVQREPNGNKTHKPWHTDSDGRKINRKGPDPWPLWREADALEHGRGRWITEAEGEKCADWLRAGGLVAVSQPGCDHKNASIERRYRLLLEADVAGVLYLADNDSAGESKAKQCAAAAAAVGLPLVVVPAAEVWPGLPVGGSIDDAPGTAAERAAALLAAIPAAVERHKQQQQAAAAPAAPQQRRPLTMAEVGDRLREAISEGMGNADLAALVAELAAASEQGAISVQRLADAICAEQLQAVAVAAEAQQIAAERDRQEIGQVLSPHYLLPASIAAAIETRARYLPCDGPSAVLPFLATVAGLVKLGTEVEGSAVAGYRVPVNLFACLVGRSGAKKSPIGRLLVEAPTADLRADLARANQREREAWEEKCRDLKKGEAKPPAPHPKRLSVSDYTGEALAAQLQTQEAAGLGLLVHRDELSGLFGSLNAYRGGRGADEQQLLELFDGSGLSSLRIVGDRWGSTQPDVLRQLVADGDASGLWARFLFVPLPERAVPLPLATSATEVDEVQAAAQTLADACRALYRLPRKTYRLAPAAAEQFAHYELNRQRAALGATIGAQSALYGKSAGKVLRLAGVLHLLQIAAGEISSSAAIEPGTIERAATLVDHLDAWALGLHAEVAAGGVGQLMRTVHRAAEAAAGALRWRELVVRLSAKQRKETDAAAFAEAARALAAAGYGEVEAGKRGAISYRSTRSLP